MAQRALERWLARDIAGQPIARRIETDRHLDLTAFRFAGQRLGSEYPIDDLIQITVDIAHRSAHLSVVVVV